MQRLTRRKGIQGPTNRNTSCTRKATLTCLTAGMHEWAVAAMCSTCTGMTRRADQEINTKPGCCAPARTLLCKEGCKIRRSIPPHSVLCCMAHRHGDSLTAGSTKLTQQPANHTSSTTPNSITHKEINRMQQHAHSITQQQQQKTWASRKQKNTWLMPGTARSMQGMAMMRYLGSNMSCRP